MVASQGRPAMEEQEGARARAREKDKDMKEGQKGKARMQRQEGQKGKVKEGLPGTPRTASNAWERTVVDTNIRGFNPYVNRRKCLFRFFRQRI